ncbi:TSUP family transporter [Kocuria sediminis]|uniref:Probable membrane transporter protein n=1 Tax=Kocuria sediminis TaxID=1038857 RepID=A0A6N8GNH8_9MICC|nr:TSUP family transporter [Kocuria sediminis]MUN64319.1 TSUP family transporter [Kocuria sediminis]
MGPVELVVVAALAILVGSVLQRVSGTGVGLVVAPTLALLLGPATGVLVTNATTTVSGFLIMLSVWQHVDWRRFALIAPAAAVGAVPAALVVRELPAAWLQVVVGGVVLLALTTMFGLPRLPDWPGRLPTVLAGTIGGFFNTTAGVAGPVMVIHSRLARWEQRSFAATLQPVFMTMGGLSVLTKTLLGAAGTGGMPPWWVAPGVVLTVVLGVRIGAVVARRVPLSAARTTALVLAGLGGAVTLVRGLIGVL